MRIAPWEFSNPPPGAKLVQNVPSELGAEAGKALARLVAPKLVADRAKHPDTLPPCDQCAFVEGTEPNRCLPTVADAMKCMIEETPFYCHKGMPPEALRWDPNVVATPKRLCAGWLASVSTVPPLPEAK